MTCHWPERRWLALLLSVLAVIYLPVLRRRRKLSLRLANLELTWWVAGGAICRRQHLPPSLLLGVAALVVAAARPMAVITLPTD